LGINQTGAELGGPVWGAYMSEIHRGLPLRSFTRPSGIVDAVVCRRSGLLPTEFCQSTRVLPFISGTVPARFCDVHGGSGFGSRLPGSSTLNSDVDSSFLDFIPRLHLDFDLFPELDQLFPQREIEDIRMPIVHIVDPFAPLDELPSGNFPETRSEPAVIPETVIQFIPREEESNDEEELEDHLPRWDMLN